SPESAASRRRRGRRLRLLLPLLPQLVQFRLVILVGKVGLPQCVEVVAAKPAQQHARGVLLGTDRDALLGHVQQRLDGATLAGLVAGIEDAVPGAGVPERAALRRVVAA